MVLAGAIGGVIGFTYGWLSRPVYTATSTFVLEEEAQGGLGAYAGVASALGVDLGGIGGGNNVLFKGDNIFELYRSRRMIEKTLLGPVAFNGARPEPLIERFLTLTGRREAWEDKPALSKLRFGIPKSKFTLLHDSIIGEAVEEINKDYLTVERPDKKISVVSVSLESEDPLFAKEFVDRIVTNVNAFYIQTKTKRSATNVKVLQGQADSVKAELLASIKGSASSRQANPNANAALPTLEVGAQRKQVDITANSAMYSEIMKNLEMAKVTLLRETPLIQEIDRPVLPLRKKKSGKLVTMLTFGIAAGFLMALWLVVRRIWNEEIAATGEPVS